MIQITDKDREEWIRLHRKLGHVPPEYAHPSRDRATIIDDQPSVAEAAARIFCAPRILTLGARRVALREPRLGEMKALLAAIAAGGSATTDGLQGLPQFERLMLACIEFLPVDHGSLDEPSDRQRWFDDLGIDDGLRLIEAFTESVDLGALIKRVEAIAGKLTAAVGKRRRT